MFSVLNMYLDHFKFCVMCIDGRRYVCCSECNAVSNECNEPTSCLVQPIGTHGGEVMYLGCVCFRGEHGFLNCDDICMCVGNKQFEILVVFFNSKILHDTWIDHSNVSDIDKHTCTLLFNLYVQCYFIVFFIDFTGILH